ncbi:GntR family transcriptional regulator [Bacillus sp. B6(2022)]|nr:GntR family transcriptional regulator [Bacillus sp. B6(2022)]
MTPSRVLAQELNVSRSTVQLAYDELLARGYVSTSRRGGTKVISSDHNAASPHIKTNRLLHFRQDLTLTRLKNKWITGSRPINFMTHLRLISAIKNQPSTTIFKTYGNARF